MSQNEDFDLESSVQRVVRDAISKYLDKKKEPDTKHAILDRIFPVERRISSIIVGLQTSLGTTVWEKLASEIAVSNGFTLHDPTQFQKPLEMPSDISDLIHDWRQKREAKTIQFKIETYISELRDICQTIKAEEITFTNVSSGDGIDLWIEKDGREYIFDLKTVQINAGSGNNFSRKVMEWYAYRLLKDSDADVRVAMAFPYSPFPPFTIESWWRKMGTRAYPLIQGEDALVQDEFWNLLSGQADTWERMLSVFDNLRSDLDKYDSLFYPDS